MMQRFQLLALGSRANVFEGTDADVRDYVRRATHVDFYTEATLAAERHCTEMLRGKKVKQPSTQ